MRVIIAEKPSVAKDIASALGSPVKKDGYYAVGNDVVTYAFGHLFRLADDLAPKQWRMDALPIVPDFRYTVDADKQKQFGIIRDLLKTANEAVIACDAGREGELIGRLIVIKAGYKGALKRFWTSEALTPEVVRREMGRLKDGKDYDSLYRSALARQHSDWLVGINMSRGVTIKASSYGEKPWTVGRVQTPVLRLIVERDLERENFTPQEYFVIAATFQKNNETYVGHLKKNASGPASTTDEEEDDPNKKKQEQGSRLTKADYQTIMQAISNETQGIVRKMKQEVKKEYPPLLHSLTSLQREANQLYGLSAQETLDAAQKLYETHKCLSYPRTDAQYLGDDGSVLATEILTKIGKQVLVAKVSKVGKRVFDSKKLTDHHALIPFAVLPTGNVTKTEQQVYGLVWRKFVGAFMDPYEYQATSVVTEVKGYMFVTNGTVPQKDGWRELYHKDQVQVQQAPTLPKLSVDDIVAKIKDEAIRRMTQPPAAYTEASILQRMKKLNLGTPATRAAILEGLKFREYITVKTKSLLSTAKGRELIHILHTNAVINPEMTAQWEEKLEKIYTDRSGKTGYEAFMGEIRGFVQASIDNVKSMVVNGKTQQQPSAGSGGNSNSSSGYGGNGKPTEKMIAFAMKIAEVSDIAIPEAAMNDFQAMKEWIDANKEKMPTRSLSEKQIAVLKKNGQEKLVEDFEKARQWLDRHFAKKSSPKK